MVEKCILFKVSIVLLIAWFDERSGTKPKW